MRAGAGPSTPLGTGLSVLSAGEPANFGDELEPGEARTQRRETMVDLVLFELGGTRFGADLTQVRRVDRVDALESAVGEVLGRPAEGRRALVFAAADGTERKLAIDQVLGVRAVPLSQLRRLPVAASAAPFSVGAWLDGNEAVLLVDLLAMPRETPEMLLRALHVDPLLVDLLAMPRETP